MAMADSPITQVSQDSGHDMIPSSSSSPITQVAPPPAPPPTAAQYYTPGQQFYPSKFILDLRGTRFDLDRETLVALPESILVVMFPNGLILRPKSSGGGGATNAAASASSSTPATATATGTGGGGVAGRGVGGTAVTAGQLKGKSSTAGGLAQAAAAAAMGAGSGVGGASANVGINNSGIATGHGHHPSESTYTDYSDYSDYSYDDYDDDDDDGHGLDREELLDDEDLTDDDEDEEEQVIVVDFDPVCLQYILDNYRQAQRAGEVERRIRRQEQERQLQLQIQQQQHLIQQLQMQQQQQQQGSAASASTSTVSPVKATPKGVTVAALPTSSESSNSSAYHQPLPLNLMVPQNPLLNKQAIIVLREELDYFVIPPSTKGVRPPTNGVTPATSTATPFSTSTPPNASVPSTSTATPAPAPLTQVSNRDSADGPLPLLGTTPVTTPAGTSKLTNGSVPTTTTATSGTAAAAPTLEQPRMIKTQCGQILLQDRKIFAALQRNIDKEKNQAEQQLMDMLCVSGFQKEGEWGYRRVEPKRTTVVSVAMVMLRTTAQPYSTATAAASSSSSSSSAPTPTAAPGRKCWWDGIQVEVYQDPSDTSNSPLVPVRLWARRTWTLELVLI
ncbi:hypothetical protein EC991_001929 [Linnemannia zychae]|nr:hypothetical protein EC991_001929 [Linnemannia zychae]